jgi:hypothetical protein
MEDKAKEAEHHAHRHSRSRRLHVPAEVLGQSKPRHRADRHEKERGGKAAPQTPKQCREQPNRGSDQYDAEDDGCRSGGKWDGNSWTASVAGAERMEARHAAVHHRGVGGVHETATRRGNDRPVYGRELRRP